MSDLWRRCLERLEGELTAEDLHTWLLPLQAREDTDGLHLYAPNAYTLDVVRNDYLQRIHLVLDHVAGKQVPLRVDMGSANPLQLEHLLPGRVKSLLLFGASRHHPLQLR